MDLSNNKIQWDKIILFIHQMGGKFYSRKKSIMFISLHKCATTYFSMNVLPYLKGLTQIDYQRLIYQNIQIGKIKSRSFGYVYGVLKIHEENHPLSSTTDILLSKKSINKKKAIILIRDPRDILVSMYYSFGFTHGLSNNQEIRDFQIQRRNEIVKMTVDEYALKSANDLKGRFDYLSSLIRHINSYVILRYEDMVINFEEFYQKLNSFVQMKRVTKYQLFKSTRPLNKEQPTKHKRSGKVAGYKSHLKSDTIVELNKIFKNTLERFDYQSEK